MRVAIMLASISVQGWAALSLFAVAVASFAYAVYVVTHDDAPPRARDRHDALPLMHDPNWPR